MSVQVEANNDGRRDVRRAAEDLAQRIPESLAPLARLAYNYRWCWTAGAPELFRAIDPGRFELCGQNPVRLLQETSAARLTTAAGDPEICAEAERLDAVLQADRGRPSAAGAASADAPIAFLCAEYGIHVSLPVYSGGLGALAGDLVKEASDRATPMVAVGLMYRKGYFRQRIDAGGWQHEYWVDTDPERVPAALVTAEDGLPLRIRVPIFGVEVAARIWRVDVGRVPLYLLDSDTPENDPVARWITARLYVSDAEARLSQYVLLGVGGVRALRAMGIEPGVLHLNEGHAALAPLELAAPELHAGVGLPDALAHARQRTVFTTHTPVPAGNDTYPTELLQAAIGRLSDELGVPVNDVMRLGAVGDGRSFGVTQAALRASRSAGGVSARHGEVAREMWQGLWPGRGLDAVPIGHVTNGVHVASWVGPAMRELFVRHLGEDWLVRVADPEAWSGLDGIPDAELWEARQRQRAALVTFLRARSTLDRLGRGDVRQYVEAADRAFHEDVLTIGFARRVATYKRLDLLTRDPEWTIALLSGDRPVQVVLAGKAHPRDEEAKRSLQRLFGMKWAQVVGERVVFLDDYDLHTAAWLVRGCDVWLNVPRPPLEASGTSGMKSAVNGGLQLSVLDGWWAEGYESGNGWALSGEIEPDHHAQDERHAAELHRLLDGEVVPAFYERAADGLPSAWLALVRASLRTLVPRFSAARMLSEYIEGPYRRRG